jgi:hypothetical protein
MGAYMTSPITQIRLKELLEYQPETGEFFWKVCRQCVPAGAKAGSLHKQKGYVFIRADLKRYAAHRLAWLYVHGQWPKNDIDHINGIRSDNRISNLRDVTHATNLLNRTAAKGATCRQSGAWEAASKRQGVTTYLGRFKTFDQANAAYMSHKSQVFSEVSQ